MEQERLFSLIRTAMTFIGAFLISGGIKIFGNVVNDVYWQEIIGVIITIISIVWSIRTKEVNWEKLQSSATQVLTFVGGILLAKGVLNEQTYLAVLAFVPAIISYIQSGISRKKNQDIASGEIKFSKLTGVEESDIAKNPYVPENKKYNP